MLILHGYFRSGASHRVRIALHLKGLQFSQISHHLRKDEQKKADYLSLNPQGMVPTLVHDGLVVTQSLAIIESLDEAFSPTPRLLPADVAGRARVRSLSAVIAADTHPLNNLRLLSHLEKNLGLSEEARNAWCHRWLDEFQGDGAPPVRWFDPASYATAMSRRWPTRVWCRRCSAPSASVSTPEHFSS